MILVILFFLFKECWAVSLKEGITLFNVKEAINLAVDNNKQLLSFKKKIDEASFQVGIACSELYPKIKLDNRLSYTEKLKREDSSGLIDVQSLSEPSYYTPSISLSISQKLFERGKIKNTIRQAKENLKATELEYQILKREIIEKTASAYYNLKKENEREKAYQKILRIALDLHNITKEKIKEGLVPEIDVRRTELNLRDLEGKINSIEIEKRIKEEVLKRLLGLNLNIKIEEALEFKQDEFDINKACEYALVNRAEIKKQRIEIDKKETGLKIAKGEKGPSIWLEGTYNWQSEERTLKKAFDNFKEDQWLCSLNISLPIFDGYRIMSNIKSASSLLDEAKIRLDDVREQIIFEIKELGMRLKELEERILRTKENIEFAKENLYIMEERYKVGKASLNEVFDTEDKLLEKTIVFIEELCDYEFLKTKFYITQGIIE